MTDILLVGNNQDLLDDLQNQIARFVPQTQFVSQNPDIIIVMQEEKSNNSLRQQYAMTPMIYLCASAPIAKDDKLNIWLKTALKLTVLLDVLQAANNKLNHSTDGYLQFNGYELRPNLREIEDLTNGASAKLTEKEVAVLQYLYKNADRYVSKNDLQTGVWQYSQEVTTHTIETHIYRLRQKVETASRRLILTNNGHYKLNMGEE